MISVNHSEVKKISWGNTPIKKAYFNSQQFWAYCPRGEYKPTSSTVLYLPLSGDLIDRATGGTCTLSGAGNFIDTECGAMYQLNGASFLTPPPVPTTITNPYQILFMSIVFQYRKNTPQSFVFYGNNYGFYNQYFIDVNTSSSGIGIINFGAHGAWRHALCSLNNLIDGNYYLVNWSQARNTPNNELILVNGLQQPVFFAGDATGRATDNINNPTSIRQIGCGHEYNKSGNSNYAVSPFCELLIESRAWTLAEMQELAVLLGFM